MRLSDKMFCKGRTACPPRTNCSRDANRAYFRSLFETDWDVFVIKRDKKAGRFDLYTLCCDDAEPMHGTSNHLAAACC